MQLLLVVLVPGLLALIFGWLAFRSRVTGVYLSILTQAMTLALSLYLFQNDSGLRGNNGLSGLQNIPGLTHVPQSVLSVWFLWASAVALALGYLLAAWVISGKFGNVIRDMEGAGLAKGWGAVNDMVTSGNVLLAKSLARVVHASPSARAAAPATIRSSSRSTTSTCSQPP